ncbi:MAG: protein kinase [Thermoanaerobaculales bacterium]
MALLPGTRLGPYEILAPLGAGGMGEVYRARDAKLGRDVAIKVLPSELANNPDALARFEREARAVAQLSHPNILAIFDFGRDGDTAFAVMELLEGETLREAVAHGALPARKVVDLGVQIAKGLAAAHEKGIVHRDLKPENVFLTADSHVKILDFGLAKVGGSVLANSGKTLTTPPEGATGPGVVLGTVGYMSPEQVRGEAADPRSDIFSFGVVLYEMLSGQRAFSRETAAESMTAILKEDPPEIVTSGIGASPALQRIVQHCLEKKPGERFQSARDIAFALQALSGSVVASGPSVALTRRGFRPWLVLGGAAAVAGGALLALATASFFRHPQEETHPVFRPLTRERGTIGAARFVPGTSDALYSARWGSGGSRLYVTRVDQPAPRVVPGFEGLLQSISTSGEIMGLTDLFISHASPVGQLVSFPISGGAARSWADNVWTVSQGERGEFALVVGVYAQEFRLEWPFGNVVVRTRDTLPSARLRGDRLAYFHEKGDTFDVGFLSVVDRAGDSRDVIHLRGFTGMAWGPEGKEIWVSTFHDGQSRLISVDLRGKARTLLSHAGRLELQDVDSSGRALVVVNSYQRQVYARAKGSSRDEDMSWLDAQAAVGITDDGKTALLARLNQWNLCEGQIYLRPLDGSPALDLGEGYRVPTLSGDGKWVLTHTRESVLSLKMVPTSPGVPRLVPIPAFEAYDSHYYRLPDGRHGVIYGRPEGKAVSLFSIDFETGAFRQIAPDGAAWFFMQNMVSPDGQWMAFLNKGQAGTLEGEQGVAYARSDGTELTPFHGLRRTEAISGWYRDSRSIVVFDRNVIPAPVDALELRTGKRTPLLKLQPPDPVGISGVQGVMMAVDGSAYAYNVIRQLSELYLIEGLK